MKKIFICALAAGMFTACSQEETLSTQAPLQISFDGAWVENATRADKANDPSTTIDGKENTKKLTEFSVWAYMDDPTGVFLKAEKVSGEKGNFTYSNTAYWYDNHDYYFAALANHTNAVVTPVSNKEDAKNGLGTVSFTNIDGSDDLLYSSVHKRIDEGADLSKIEKVMFTFNHLLSKVKFSFKNTYANPNISIEVKDITMTAPESGTINLNSKWWEGNNWVLGNTVKDLNFGTTGKIAQSKEQECAQERLTIPTDPTKYDNYVIKFNVVVSNGNMVADTYPHEITLTGVSFEMGKAYDLVAELNASNIVDPDDETHEGGPYEIVFDVEEVKDWIDGDAINVIQTVADEAELKAAVAQGGEIYLEKTITLTGTLNIAEDAVLYLNGNTLTNQTANISTDVIVVDEGATLTINGEGTVEAVTGNDGYAVIADGTVIINGGTFKSGVDANGAANAVVYARNNGKVYVNGGTFPNGSNSAYVLNKKDPDRATTVISVTGGTFTNFNPANNAAEGAGTNFLAEGYKSTETTEGSNVWTVTKDE